MTSDIVEKLNQLDINKLTIEDIQSLRNITLRNALLRMLRDGGLSGGLSGQLRGTAGGPSGSTERRTKHEDFLEELPD